MKRPPYLVRMRIEDEERVKVRLWVPVFLLWPLLLVVLLLGIVLALLVDLFTVLSGRRAGYARLLVGCCAVVGEASGTEVEVAEKSKGGRNVAFTVR